MTVLPTQQLVDHLFRHESGKMVAVLTRIFGMHNLEMVEDVVQESFLKAMQFWKFDNMPDNPAAWLMQTARNKAIDIIRREQYFHKYSAELSGQLLADTEATVGQFFSEAEISDSQLRLIFACCHPQLKEEDQVALTLKTVSGFGPSEIARALVTTESTIQKRLYRAKEYIREHQLQMEIPAGYELNKRLETVYVVLYLLFNEGYNSLKADELIRKDVCAEAMRLCLLLTESKAGNKPATFALLSLMCLQASRFDSRLDEDNTIVLLEKQDRSKWDMRLIQLGYKYLNFSSSGDTLSIYHIESAIAAEHCMAATYEETNWKRMLQLYDMLLLQKPAPVVKLNRAVVLMQTGEVNAAIDMVWKIEEIEKLLASQHIYSAVLGEMYKQKGNFTEAQKLFRQSLQLVTSLPEKKLLETKIAACISRLK
ncbi:MAG: sigma-70 family RNA polymerase sigma factor [Filimonas sp.]|nr:sigma-70 family RNA polymerase sigma factor [Filimonas sp.]